MAFTDYVADANGPVDSRSVITSLTEVAEMHCSEHTAAVAHCWWQHALLQPSRRRTRQVCPFVGVDVSLDWRRHFHVTRLMKLTARASGHTIFDLNGPLL